MKAIACPMWPGNTTDAAIIAHVAISLRSRFGVSHIRIVADRGMVGKKNAQELEGLGFSYVLGHVFVSFLALPLMHELKERTGGVFEWEQMVQDLDSLYQVEVVRDGKTWKLRSPLQGMAGKIFKAAGAAAQPAAREADPNAKALFRGLNMPFYLAF